MADLLSRFNRMVTASTGVQTDLPEVVHSSCRPVCHSSEPQTPSLRVSNSRPKGLGHRCSEHKLNGSHGLCLPSDGSPSQGDPKNQAMPLPNHSNSSRLARDVLVLGPSAALNRDPTTTPGVNDSTQTVPQVCVPQQSTTSQPPRQVTTPRTRLLCGGGRENWLLSSFHRDHPKSSRNLPKWNLSVVLNELIKAPFEPMKDTDLLHLTLKTAFLLALASSKCHSEIYACVANKVSNLGQWEKVALFPSSDFIAKNQLAREGSQSVSPVTIPALTTIVDRQFKEDRILCPVWALRYYLDRTQDLRGSRSLLFISFKKGRTSDMRPTTLSSWLKQTILLCYKQADQQALDLVQVKAHDIRAFAASKAFYGGVSVDQIMQACHWKVHNTFTNFYLKDLTWSDNDNNMYLGPVVAAQQLLDPSPQNSHPRKEKKGGAHPLQPSLQESYPRV